MAVTRTSGSIVQILPRDYLITPEGLAFAVVDFGTEDGQIACCFRYFQNQDGNCYDQPMFQAVRQLFQHAAGPFTPLTRDDWQKTYRRRSCSLPFDTYLWHEQRKHNKAMIGSTKIDISLVCSSENESPNIWQKKGEIQLVTRVTGDSRAFQTPACWKVAHQSIEEVITYSATYTGQALLGEEIEIAGLLEESGKQRVIVGQSREANGAFIRVVPL